MTSLLVVAVVAAVLGSLAVVTVAVEAAEKALGLQRPEKVADPVEAVALVEEPVPGMADVDRPLEFGSLVGDDAPAEVDWVGEDSWSLETRAAWAEL